MNMRRVVCISIFVVSLTCGIRAHADDAPIPADQLADKIMPAFNQASQEVNEQDVDRRNDAESNNGNIERTEYLENGLIDLVTYVDGTAVKYSYEYEEGKKDPVKVTLSSSDGVRCAFQEDDGQTVVLVYDRGNADGSPAAVVVPVSEGKPADFARQPISFDFKGIKEALDRVSEEKEDALKQYVKNTEPYYEKVAIELERISGCLKAEGIIVKTDPAFMEKNGGTFDEGKRKAIDEAVRYTREAAPKVMRERPYGPAVEFLENERSCREEFLSPNKEIYDDKVKKAVEYLNGAVDRLVNSGIAVYFKSKDGRIDALIKLPKRTNS